jgi:uncharacterized membrane protein
MKSATFGVLHLVIAFSAGYALTVSLMIAGTLSRVEPLVNTVAHDFFECWWGHPALLAWWHCKRPKLLPADMHEVPLAS